MARVTLHPALNTITGAVRGALFRRAARGSLLVRPPVPVPLPSAAQLKRRAAWQRLDHLYKPLEFYSRGYFNTLAEAADDCPRRYNLRTRLAQETAQGASGIFNYDAELPALTGTDAYSGGVPGQIELDWDIPADVGNRYLGITLRRHPAPGQPAIAFYCLQSPSARWIGHGNMLITGLKPGVYYAISMQMHHSLTHLFGPSELFTDIQAAP